MYVGVESRTEAVNYIKRGWTIVPLCWPDGEGNCGAGHHSCLTVPRNIGKAPFTQYNHIITFGPGQEEEARAFWDAHPEANVGIRLEESGLLVIDIDDLEAVPEEHRAEFERYEHYVTSGRGRHIYFHRGNLPALNRKQRGWEIRGKGHVVAPPSRHREGAEYRWSQGVVVIYPTVPAFVEEIIRSHTAAEPASVRIDWDRLPTVDISRIPLSEATRDLIRFGAPKGRRSEALWRVIGDLVRAGCDNNTIAAIITNPTNLISEKVLEKTPEQRRRYVEYQIAKMRSELWTPQPVVEPRRGHAMNVVVAEHFTERLAGLGNSTYLVRTHGTEQEERSIVVTPVSSSVPTLPLDVLPPELGCWIEDVAESMAAPVDYVTGAVLGVAAGALGGTFRLKINHNWVEAPRLWIALVGGSGDGKTPTFNTVLRPLVDAHERLYNAYRYELEEYERRLEEWEQAVKAWKRQNRGTEMPPKPGKPKRSLLMVTDTTREALIDILENNPSGVLVFADELAGLVRDWTRYRDDGGRQFWLSLWSGSPIHFERKTSGERFVKEPFVTLLGGIQPRVVRDVSSTDEYGDDGLLARFLFVYPEVPPVPEEIPPTPDSEIWDEIVEGLLGARSGSGKTVLSLSQRAAELFYKNYAWAQNVARGHHDEHMAAIYSKASSQAARLALVLTAIQSVYAGVPVERLREVDEKAVEGAWALVRVFIAHADKVLSDARKSPKEQRIERLIAWIQKRGGEVKVRDIYTNQVAGIRNKKEAEALLNELVELGYGELVARGSNSQFFRLTPNP